MADGAEELGGSSRRLGRLAPLGRCARAVLDLIYPPHCVGCGAATETAGALCGPCWRDLAFITRPYCERLGTPFAQELGPGVLSPRAIAQPPSFGRARAAVLFRDGPARRLVHRLKYGDRHEVAALMGGLMARAAVDFVADGPVLVPMPLHRLRLWRRQFNQAALLAKAVGGALRLPVDPLLLQRVKPTDSQTGLSRTQRHRNVQGAFRVAEPGAARGRAVLLVDDVMTTGATADAAARALLRDGASRVDVLVFAQVAGDAGATI